MQSFAYTARDAAGQTVRGTMNAKAANEVGKMLRAEGKLPMTVQPTASRAGPKASKGIKVTRKEVIQMSTQLAIMVETGVTITEALDCIATQMPNPRMRKLMSEIGSHVQAGGDFSDALARHPKSFPTLYTALIRASEKSGMLPKMLQRATTYLREEAEIVRKVRGALTYPSIMLAFAVTTTIFLLIFVLPRFTALYATKKAALPTPTKILMGISDALLYNWMYLIPALLAVVAAIWASVTFTETGRNIAYTLQIRVPVIGSMFRQLYLARGLRMVGTMASSGVHLVDCVTTARDLCNNIHFKKLWNEVEQQLHVGKQMSEPLFNNPTLVPRSIAQMISSAEKGGKLAAVMEQVAAYSEEELKERITEMTRYIEPAMIVLMGALIGGVALALLLPVFTISRVMSQ